MAQKWWENNKKISIILIIYHLYIIIPVFIFLAKRKIYNKLYKITELQVIYHLQLFYSNSKIYYNNYFAKKLCYLITNKAQFYI